MTQEQEEKRAFVEELSRLFQKHRLWSVQEMSYHCNEKLVDDETMAPTLYAEAVCIQFRPGYAIIANVSADSKEGIVCDILRRIQ